MNRRVTSGDQQSMAPTGRLVLKTKTSMTLNDRFNRVAQVRAKQRQEVRESAQKARFAAQTSRRPGLTFTPSRGGRASGRSRGVLRGSGRGIVGGGRGRATLRGRGRGRSQSLGPGRGGGGRGRSSSFIRGGTRGGRGGRGARGGARGGRGTTTKGRISSRGGRGRGRGRGRGNDVSRETLDAELETYMAAGDGDEEMTEA
ncbi:chromatin target of PRMT1 protein-like [Oscarella lobularis]|uniref:chromatin target of PRMT1 protein-like n=1 Tax=Oscarella lobularis TaxID=121494 RepID=UPI003313E7A2